MLHILEMSYYSASASVGRNLLTDCSIRYRSSLVLQNLLAIGGHLHRNESIDMSLPSHSGIYRTTTV